MRLAAGKRELLIRLRLPTQAALNVGDKRCLALGLLGLYPDSPPLSPVQVEKQEHRTN